jgi:hypothetical protein
MRRAVAKPQLDNHTAALILVDAILTNDRTAAAKHGITDRTLRRYRDALRTDQELSALFQLARKDAAQRSWAQELDAGLVEVITQIRTRSERLPDTPEGYQAIVDAARALGEIAVAREVLGATAREDGAFEAAEGPARSAAIGPN